MVWPNNVDWTMKLGSTCSLEGVLCSEADLWLSSNHWACELPTMQVGRKDCRPDHYTTWTWTFNRAQGAPCSLTASSDFA